MLTEQQLEEGIRKSENVAKAMTSSCPHLRDDAVSAAMEGALYAWRTYDGATGTWEGYCHQTVKFYVRKIVFDPQRAAWKRANLDWNHLPMEAADRVGRETDHVTKLALRGALEKLNKVDRWVVTEHYLRGRSHAEIADDTGYTRGWVTKRINVALKAMKEHLN